MNTPVESFCGLPLRPEILAYLNKPQEQIRYIISHIQICSHGPTCTFCCFNYFGIRRSRFVGFTGVKVQDFFELERDFSPRQLKLGNFLYKCTHNIPEGTINVRKRCKNAACFNMAHLVMDRCKTDVSEVWNDVKVCEHGKSCEVCCWQWLGSIQKGKKLKTLVLKTRNPLYFKGKKVGSAREALYSCLLDKRLPKNKYLMVTCKNSSCCNVHHTRIISRSDFMFLFVLPALAENQRRKKYGK